MTTLTPEEMNAIAVAALAEAVDKLGGQTATAKVAGVSQPSVFRWLRGNPMLPVVYAPPIELALREKGHTRPDRHDLRPDFFGPRDDHAASIDLEPAR